MYAGRLFPGVSSDDVALLPNGDEDDPELSISFEGGDPLAWLEGPISDDIPEEKEPAKFEDAKKASMLRSRAKPRPGTKYSWKLPFRLLPKKKKKESGIVGIDARGIVGRMPVERAAVSLSSADKSPVVVSSKLVETVRSAQDEARMILKEKQSGDRASRRAQRMEVYRQQRKTWLVTGGRRGSLKKRGSPNARNFDERSVGSSASKRSKEADDDDDDVCKIYLTPLCLGKKTESKTGGQFCVKDADGLAAPELVFL